MHPTKQDDELWFVQLYNNDIEVYPIPKDKAHIYKQNYIFEDYDDALKCSKYLRTAYFGTFQRRPLIKIETIDNYLMELIEIELSISEQLSDYPNFDGIDFVDVSANGIQIRGFHKRLTGMIYGSQPTIKYDFSNYKECIEEFVEMWENNDTKQKTKYYKSFSDSTNKWGFN